MRTWFKQQSTSLKYLYPQDVVAFQILAGEWSRRTSHPRKSAVEPAVRIAHLVIELRHFLLLHRAYLCRWIIHAGGKHEIGLVLSECNIIFAVSSLK